MLLSRLVQRNAGGDAKSLCRQPKLGDSATMCAFQAPPFAREIVAWRHRAGAIRPWGGAIFSGVLVQRWND